MPEPSLLPTSPGGPDAEPEPLYDVNTSGTQGPLPPEIEAMTFNAGAFFGGFVWAAGNRAWVGLTDLLWYVVVPVLPVWRLVMALRGNEWAWRSRRWDSVEHFQRAQRRWGWAGFMLALLQVVVATALFIKVGAALVPIGGGGGGG